MSTASVNDMARFVKWQLRLVKGGEPELLKSTTLAEMQRPHWVYPDWSGGWGLGFELLRLEDRTLIGHSGGYPGYLTHTNICRDDLIGSIVLTNTMDGMPGVITDRIHKWVAPAITKAVQGVAGVEPDPAWRTYEGTYRTRWADSHVMLLEGKLVMLNPNVSNPKQTMMALKPAGPHTFTIEGDGSGPLGEKAIFTLDEAGEATHVTIGVNPAKRISYPS